jgi:hypothetical protein
MMLREPGSLVKQQMRLSLTASLRINFRSSLSENKPKFFIDHDARPGVKMF